MTFEEFSLTHSKKSITEEIGVIAIDYEITITELEKRIKDIKEAQVEVPYGYLEHRREVLMDDCDRTLEFNVIMVETSWHFLKRMREEWKNESQRLKAIEESQLKRDEYHEYKIQETELKQLKDLAKKYNIGLVT